MTEVFRDVRERVKTFEAAAHEILREHETSISRVISLNETRKKLDGLSLQQSDLFLQALECTQLGIYRAAYVMAWAAFIDFVEETIALDGLSAVKNIRSGWVKFNSIEEIRENIPEYQIIEAARDLGLFTKSQGKTVLGLLARRNECAHPSSYDPGLNESLGFVTELLNRVSHIQARKSP